VQSAVIAQDGSSERGNLSGTVKPITGYPVLVGYKNWPGGFTTSTNMFAGACFTGTTIWLAPADADRVVSIDVATASMLGYNAYLLPSRYQLAP